MERKRRSGRIAKELDILLLGTDTAGKVIMEQTKTVVLSRHGAGIVSRYRFSPDDLLTLSLPDAAKEAEIRLVGQIGGELGRYTYGVAFVDPDPHFWPMEFPAPESFESADAQMLLECSRCQARQTIEQHEIEEDVYSVNGYILRQCEQCGTSTPWKKAEARPASAAEAAPVVSKEPAEFRSEFKPASRPSGVPSSNGSPARTRFTGVQAAPPPTPFRPDASVPAASFGSFEPGLSESPVGGSGRSSYSGASAVPEFASLAEIQSSSSVAGTTALFQELECTAASSDSRPQALSATASAVLSRAMSVREHDAHGRPVNRRRHVRIRVNFSACVRHPAQGDEVVECENVSKGGACFHSLRQYPLESAIEIAAPFSLGEAALFVPAKIKRVEILAGTEIFRYGVAYNRL
jgi:PilZ domain